MMSKMDRALVARAVKQRWPISDAVKAKLCDGLDRALDAAGDDPRHVASIGRTLAALEGQNQADELEAGKNARLDGGLATENVTHIMRVEFGE